MEIETFISFLPELKHFQHSAFQFFALVVVIILSFYTYISVKKGRRGFLIILLDTIVNFWKETCEGIMGEEGRRYVPFVSSIFIFILVMNLMGLIPGFMPPTMNINTNLGMAVFVFFAYNIIGFREHGIKYVKHFIGPLPIMAVLYMPVEIISHVFRMVSLSVRLAGNMFGDHSVLEIFTHLVPILVPVVFLILGSIVSLVQAFVFSLLSAIYISLAISHEH